MQEAHAYTDWSAEEWREWWESLGTLRRACKGPASREAFCWIWMQCGGQVRGQFRFYLPHLAATFGKSIRSAQDWLDYLQKAELLFVRNRTLKGQVPEGWIVLDVYHPNPELRDRPIRVDPQRWLPGMADEADAPPIVAQCSSSEMRKPPGISARKPPGISARKPRDFRKTPCEDAILKGVASGQVTMTQALTMMGEARGPPRQRPKTVAAPDIRYQKSRNLNLDIRDLTQEAFEQRIHQALGDPELHPSPVRKIAKKLADGSLDWEDVQRIIDKSRQMFRDGKTPAPWIYFVGAMRMAFEERGWRWRGSRKSKSHAE